MIIMAREIDNTEKHRQQSDLMYLVAVADNGLYLFRTAWL